MAGIAEVLAAWRAFRAARADLYSKEGDWCDPDIYKAANKAELYARRKVYKLLDESADSITDNTPPLTWRPVDSAPKDTNVLLDVRGPYGGVKIGYHAEGDWWWTDNCFCPRSEILGWMPLPESMNKEKADD